MPRAATTAILSVRVSPGERSLLEEAASRARTTLSDFVRRQAVLAAEMEILERSAVTIPVEDWERFEEWLHSPPRELPALRERAARKPIWEE